MKLKPGCWFCILYVTRCFLRFVCSMHNCRLLFFLEKNATNRLVFSMLKCAGTHTTSKPERTNKYRMDNPARSKKSWEPPSGCKPS